MLQLISETTEKHWFTPNQRWHPACQPVDLTWPNEIIRPCSSPGDGARSFVEFMRRVHETSSTGKRGRSLGDSGMITTRSDNNKIGRYNLWREHHDISLSVWSSPFGCPLVKQDSARNGDTFSAVRAVTLSRDKHRVQFTDTFNNFSPDRLINYN